MTYFAQFTDIHLSTAGTVEAANAERHLVQALDEVSRLDPRIEFVVITGDIGSTETDAELQRYQELTAGVTLPLYAFPSGTHDMWRSDEPWRRRIGARRYWIDRPEMRLLFLDEPGRGRAPHYRRIVGEEELAWVEAALQGAGERPIIVGHHSPILQGGAGYADIWAGESNAARLLELLARHRVMAMITGHWHLNGEWRVDPGGLRMINTGALCGWGWNGLPPAPRFGLRPGYRLFRIDDGRLESCWRELGARTQVGLVYAGGVHTGGPRPQARCVEIGRPAELRVEAFSLDGPVSRVEWALCTTRSMDALGRVVWEASPPGWTPLEPVSAHLWSNWKGMLHPDRGIDGEGAIVVRACVGDAVAAYDAVPVTIGGGGDVRAGRMTHFVLDSAPR